MQFDSQPPPRSQGFSAPMRVAVEARDREPCAGGVSGAGAGKKSAPPPHSCCPLGWDSERSFFSQCQSRSAGEGGKEDRRASRRWGKPGSRTRAVSTALETGQRTQPATSCGNPAGLAGSKATTPCFYLVSYFCVGSGGFLGQVPPTLWAEHKTQKLGSLPAHYRARP